MIIRLERFYSTYATMVSWQILTLGAVAALVAAVAGPFGTFSAMPLGGRFLYWGAIVLSSVVLGYTGYALVRLVVDPDNKLRTILWGSLAGTVLVTGAVWTCNTIAAASSDLEPPTFWVLLSYVALINASVGVLRLLLMHHTQTLAPASEEQSDMTLTEVPRLARRLPPEVQGDILHMSVKDHFVEVNTNNGSASIRMRFRDALDELDGVHGYRVHRSHWVAHRAVQGIEKDQARVFLRLPEGKRVPVSRNYHTTLEEAGWL